MATSGTINMQITSDRPCIAELAPTEEQIRAAMSRPSATQVALPLFPEEP